MSKRTRLDQLSPVPTRPMVNNFVLVFAVALFLINMFKDEIYLRDISFRSDLTKKKLGLLKH